MTRLEATGFEVTAFVVLGFIAGALFFALLRWNTSLYVRGGSVALALAVQAVRIAGISGLLVLTASHGALPLLLTTLGVLLARPVVVRCMVGRAA